MIPPPPTPPPFLTHLQQALRASAEFLGRNSAEFRHSINSSPPPLNSSSSLRAAPPLSDDASRVLYQSFDPKAAYFIPPALADVIAARAPSDLLRINNTGMAFQKNFQSPLSPLTLRIRRRSGHDPPSRSQHRRRTLCSPLLGHQGEKGGEAANRSEPAAFARAQHASPLLAVSCLSPTLQAGLKTPRRSPSAAAPALMSSSTGKSRAAHPAPWVMFWGAGWTG